MKKREMGDEYQMLQLMFHHFKIFMGYIGLEATEFALFCVLITALCCHKNKKGLPREVFRKIRKERMRFAFAAGWYGAVVFYLAILMRIGRDKRAIAWLPNMIEEIQSGHGVHILENFLIFLPCGMIFYYIFRNQKKTVLKVTLATAAISFSIEVTQYIFALGMTEMNDLIFNTFGGTVGSMLCLSVQKLVRNTIITTESNSAPKITM